MRMATWSWPLYGVRLTVAGLIGIIGTAGIAIICVAIVLSDAARYPGGMSVGTGAASHDLVLVVVKSLALLVGAPWREFSYKNCWKRIAQLVICEMNTYIPHGPTTS